MRAKFDKRWLLPLGILAASALVALGIVVFGPSSVGRSSGEVAQQAASEPTETSEKAASCSGASATDYGCYRQRYRDLVLDSGVEAAFVELKDEYTKNDFVKSSCHQLTHDIGHAAAQLYGDVPGTFSRGDDFCAQGYYHGAMMSVAARIGSDRILEEADTLCADLREKQSHSVYYLSCVHGLGHGIMGVLEYDLFESLRACDALSDGRERDNCYAGVFMENMMAHDNPNHHSEHLKADQPLYPCTDVEARYKNSCYLVQTSYALRTQGNDFAKVFDLCGEVEDAFRPTCYRGLGREAAAKSIRNHVTDLARNDSTSLLCMLGEDREARSNCVVGAVRHLILHYHSDTEAKALCESFDAESLRAVCLREGEEFYRIFDPA